MHNQQIPISQCLAHTGPIPEYLAFSDSRPVPYRSTSQLLHYLLNCQLYPLCVLYSLSPSKGGGARGLFYIQDQMSQALGFQNTVTEKHPVVQQEYHTSHFLHFDNL